MHSLGRRGVTFEESSTYRYTSEWLSSTRTKSRDLNRVGHTSWWVAAAVQAGSRRVMRVDGGRASYLATLS